MTKTEYKQARRLVRDNGCNALNWIPRQIAMEMDMVLDQLNATDPLAERAEIIAWCQREGLPCNVRHTSPRISA